MVVFEIFQSDNTNIMRTKNIRDIGKNMDEKEQVFAKKREQK